MNWTTFSKHKSPPKGFMLVYVEFASPTDPGAQPRILIAYHTREDYWSTTHGRLKGHVTHFRPLPSKPNSDIEITPPLYEKHLEDNSPSLSSINQALTLAANQIKQLELNQQVYMVGSLIKHLDSVTDIENVFLNEVRKIINDRLEIGSW